ncbi:MAG TPA: diacylglycerol kinase family protein [Acidimicrobiia bacterium]
MTWWVIVNPHAGRRGETERRTRLALAAVGVAHEVRVSARPEHVPQLVAEGRAAGCGDFAAVGGDGTAHLVLNGLMAEPWPSPPTLAILPAGSGSDFIRTFALPKRLEDAARHLATDSRYRCDVGVLEGNFGRRWFLNVADMGIAAGSVLVADALPRFFGGWRYRVGFWLYLARFGADEIELVAGDHFYRGSAINVVAANGQFFGGGLNIAPRAAVTDGLFDIQVFTGPRRHAFTIMPRVPRGTHLGHRGVRRFTAAEFSLSCRPGWPVEADGEVIGRGAVAGRVVPGAIDFKI